jgi:hypothetical protein
MATVDAMKVANKEMKRQYKGIDIDKIEVRHVPAEPQILKSPSLTSRAFTMTWRT